ncbi:MAG TPA: AMP-binding protein [Acidobacteriota bacterium]|nr:AMP-binding protein [Acidobacteriota bacterium]
MNEASRDFIELLRRHATANSARPAFRLAGDRGTVVLTYGALAERVQRLGSAMAAAGVRDGERVALCMENRPAWPIGYLATWYANATVVPIDPALEPHAIRRVLEHSGARLILTSHALGPKFIEACAGLDDPPLQLDVDASGDRRWDGESEEGGVPAAAGEDCGTSWDEFVAEHRGCGDWSPLQPTDVPATIMYTSGTTGLPKGVALSRAALAANIEAGLRSIDLTADDHVLGVLPLFHALPLMASCLAPIFVGGQATFLADLNPDRIIAAFPRFGITAFACVPLFFYRFHDRLMGHIRAMPPLRRRLAHVLLRLSRLARKVAGVAIGRRLFAAAHAPFGSQLRIFLIGGAKFDAQVFEDFLDLGFPLLQGYGLTEATAVLTIHPLTEQRPNTVGRPVDGVELRIQSPDETGVGEIVARSPSRMIGYYRNPEATADVFDGDWLKTGDLGRLLSNGHLQVTGRAKDIVVLASGKNIYPEELEDVYGRSEFIDEICVLGIEDPERRGAERLHAVIVPNVEHAQRAGHVNIREMVVWEIDGIGMQLPAPQRVTSLEVRREPLPRTTTRKLKRFELKREILARGDDRHQRAELLSEATEDEPPWAQTVRSILARHARVEAVARAQHLDLDLGLESLDRIEVHAELAEALRLDLPQQAAAGVQTVGELLDLVGTHIDGSDSAIAAAGDRWARVFAATPPEIEPYLRTRAFWETGLFGVFRLARWCMSWWGFEVRGLDSLPREFPFILAPNHMSFVDPFLLVAALPRGVFDRIFFVGYSAYFSGLVLGSMARLLRTVPIDQSRNLERAMQTAAAGLRRGMVLGIFPEGGRSNDGTVKQFRRGTGILARHLEVPVVPVGIWGSYEMWPRDGRPRGHASAVVFGEAMSLSRDADRESQACFMRTLRERVIELVREGEAIYRPKKK